MEYLGIAAAVVSAVAALVAVWYTRRSARMDEQGLALSLEQERRKQPDLGVHLIDAYIERPEGERTRVYVFHVSLCNRSDTDTSLKSISLEVELGRDAGPSSLFVLTHDARLAAALEARVQGGVLRVPCKIAAGEAIEAWAIFGLSDDLLRGATVQAYRLQVVDTHDVRSCLEPIALCERVSHEQVAQRDNPTEPQG